MLSVQHNAMCGTEVKNMFQHRVGVAIARASRADSISDTFVVCAHENAVTMTKARQKHTMVDGHEQTKFHGYSLRPANVKGLVRAYSDSGCPCPNSPVIPNNDTDAKGCASVSPPANIQGLCVCEREFGWQYVEKMMDATEVGAQPGGCVKAATSRVE